MNTQNTLINSSRKYAEYCKEHAAEFNFELKEEASSVFSSWALRLGALVLLASSVVTYLDASGRGNPNAIYTLFAYTVPILISVLYPIVTLVFAKVEKYSSLALDIYLLSVLISYCVILRIVFNWDYSVDELEAMYQVLNGQQTFIVMVCTGFAYHVSYSTTLIRNVVFTAITIVGIYLVNPEFLVITRVHVLQGFGAGCIVSWLFSDMIRARFYLKSTDADTRQHLYNQLSKLVYPHQLERIKLGDELENTMPLKEGKAIINVFDVQRSSDIRHEKTAEFFMNLFQSFLQICMKGYEHNPLRSQAFRLKETGDGFISSVGYPFLPVDARSLADSAVATALTMFEAFNQEVERFNYSRPIKAAMGLAYNSVQGTFQSGGIRSYDLFGEALIQASKYEELRKQPAIWDIFCRHAEERGFEDFNILIVQEVVYNSLSPPYRELFTEIDLNDKELIGGFQMMYDNDARFIYFHLLA